MKKLPVICAVMGGLLATSLADFALLDDFESYTDGAISPQSTSWSFDTADGTVASASGNKYLVQGDTSNAHTLFNNGDTLLGAGIGTYFFRASMPVAGSHQGAAFSNRDTFQEGWSDAKGIVRFGGDGGSLGDTIYGRDGAAYPAIADGTVDTWYNFWLVIDNSGSGQSYDIYMQSDDDLAFNTQTNIASGFGYRATGTNLDPATSIESLIFRTANDGSAAYFDDLYFDGAGENLINPIPEPGTLGLIAVFGGGVLFIRRRFMM